MRFFTDEKYKNGSAFIDYEKYCKSIWYKVPIGIRKICKDMLPVKFDYDIKYGLHDGRITRFEDDHSINEINIQFLAFDEQENEFVLNGIYKDARCLNKPVQTFVGDDSDCDIMCHEVICFKSNRFIHSLLFASGEKLIIEFSGFELTINNF